MQSGIKKLEDRPLGPVGVSPLEAVSCAFEHDEVGWHGSGRFTRLGDINHDTPVARSIRIGGFLYSVSSGQVKVHRLESPTAEVAAVTLTSAPNLPLPGPVILESITEDGRARS